MIPLKMVSLLISTWFLLKLSIFTQNVSHILKDRKDGAHELLMFGASQALFSLILNQTISPLGSVLSTFWGAQFSGGSAGYGLSDHLLLEVLGIELGNFYMTNMWSTIHFQAIMKISHACAWQY